MVAIHSKNQSQASQSPLDLSPKEQQGALSFSSLLDGVVNGDGKMVQNGAWILSLKDAKDLKVTDLDALGELVKGEKDDLDLLKLNPEITSGISVKELKVLIKEAKAYLKNRITQLDGFKKSEIQNLPKTLKGLLQVAKQYGIGVQEITLEDVAGTKKELTTLSKSLQGKEKTKHSHQNTQTQNSSDMPDVDIDVQELSKNGKRVTDAKVAQTPLFKEIQPQKITTEQIMSTKIAKEINKSQKQRQNNTLELLLRGEKVAKQDTTLTRDFSVATARVVASSAKTDSQTQLENLLKGEQDTTESGVKHEGVGNLKSAESFELKLNEAKQMTKYLSQDVKQAIENYKAPFTRVKVQLNPQHLGEMELTVVQRGKNLHINLSSNNAAINALVMNANDLKLQLQNNGIQNASLNFSSGSQSEQSGAGSQPQHHHQHNQNAHEEYGYFEEEHAHEETMQTLEIVVPRYV